MIIDGRMMMVDKVMEVGLIGGDEIGEIEKRGKKWEMGTV